MKKTRMTYLCIVTFLYKKKEVEIDDSFQIKQNSLNENMTETEERAKVILFERYAISRGGNPYTKKEWKRFEKDLKVKIHLINLGLDKY